MFSGIVQSHAPVERLSPTGPTGGPPHLPHLLNLGCLPRDLRETFAHRVTLWICSNIYALILVYTLFLGFEAQAHLLARLSSRRMLHYDLHGAISSQRGSLCGLDALWHGLQYLFQWFVEEEWIAGMSMTLTSFRL